MADFWFMNGYGIYVWPAYGAAAVILGGLMIYVYRRMKRLERA